VLADDNINTARRIAAIVPRVESWHCCDMDVGEPPVGYTLQAEHPKSGTAIVESHATMKAAIARAAELITGGYCVEIGSPPILSKLL
jgi:hypothetical protein